jgi:hypothetical protein
MVKPSVGDDDKFYQKDIDFSIQNAIINTIMTPLRRIYAVAHWLRDILMPAQVARGAKPRDNINIAPSQSMCP